MKIVGLTGGIGSGKTTVAKMFAEIGIPVYIADVEAKLLMNRSKVIKRKLIKLFGDKVYSNNVLNKRFIADKIFNNKALLAEMNAIVHPKVASHFKRWLLKQKGFYCIKEAAILFESGSNKSLDEVIYVSAPESLRIKRVCLRDGVEADQVKSRIKNQWNEEKKLKLSDHVVINDDIKMVIPQVLKLNQRFLQ
jgi:dephospho-CoA kinase